MLKTTTAKIEYRDYVPWGVITTEFCHVEFYGFRADEMKRKWDAIENKRYKEYDSLYKQNEIKIKDWFNEASIIRCKVRKFKPFYRFWYTKNEKELLARANKLLSQVAELEKENKKIKKKRFFGIYECRRKIEALLQQNGFVLTHTFSSEEYITKTDVWTCEE